MFFIFLSLIDPSIYLKTNIANSRFCFRLEQAWNQRKKKCHLFAKTLWTRRKPSTIALSGKWARGRDSIYKSRWPPVSRFRFRAVSIFCPPTNILRIERQVATEFRRNNARSVDRVSFAIRPLVFLPVPLISGFLWEAFATGSSWDDSRFAFRSIAPRAGKRGCSPSYKRGQSFETADSITACANNNQNSLGPLYFSFQEKNKNSKFRI